MLRPQGVRINRLAAALTKTMQANAGTFNGGETDVVLQPYRSNILFPVLRTEVVRSISGSAVFSTSGFIHAVSVVPMMLRWRAARRWPSGRSYSCSYIMPATSRRLLACKPPQTK